VCLSVFWSYILTLPSEQMWPFFATIFAVYFQSSCYLCYAFHRMSLSKSVNTVSLLCC
jgi:hypothetical protein